MTDSASIRVSLIAPIFNEYENLPDLVGRVEAVMQTQAQSWEFICVDDGSRDRTYKLLEEIAAVDSRVLVVKLRRNFGQTSALSAGFDHASFYLEFIL